MNERMTQNQGYAWLV